MLPPLHGFHLNTGGGSGGGGGPGGGDGRGGIGYPCWLSSLAPRLVQHSQVAVISATAWFGVHTRYSQKKLQPFPMRTRRIAIRQSTFDAAGRACVRLSRLEPKWLRMVCVSVCARPGQNKSRTVLGSKTVSNPNGIIGESDARGFKTRRIQRAFSFSLALSLLPSLSLSLSLSHSPHSPPSPA